MKGGTRPHKLRCQQPHGGEGREKPQAQDPVHLVAWPAAAGSQRQQARQPCVLRYGLGDRTCSAGVQAGCPGEAAASRGSAVAPSWGCRPQARGGAGDAHTHTHASSFVHQGWEQSWQWLAAVAVITPFSGDFFHDPAACLLWGGCGCPQAALCPPQQGRSSPGCQGAGACSGSAQGLAAGTSRGPSKLSHALPSSLQRSRGERPGWGLRRGLRLSLPTPKHGGRRAPGSRFCPAKAVLGMLGRQVREGDVK